MGQVIHLIKSQTVNVEYESVSTFNYTSSMEPTERVTWTWETTSKSLHSCHSSQMVQLTPLVKHNGHMEGCVRAIIYLILFAQVVHRDVVAGVVVVSLSVDVDDDDDEGDGDDD